MSLHFETRASWRVGAAGVLGHCLPALLAGWFGTCFAQAELPKCSLTDLPCINRLYERVCDGVSTADSCLASLREFEQSPSLDVRSSVAGMYLLMAGYWGAGNPEPRLEARAAELIHGVLEENPAHADALIGLANIAPTSEERIRALRRVVAVDPNPRNLESLAGAIANDGGSHAESAALLERAYESAMRRSEGPYARRFARGSVYEYRQAGLPDRANRLLARFARDLRLDSKLAETAHAGAVESARLDGVLGELCSEPIVRLFGGARCLAGIQHVVDAADRGAGAEKARLAKSASDAMFLAAQTGDMLSDVDPAWRAGFEETLRRYHGANSAAAMHQVPIEITVE